MTGSLHLELLLHVVQRLLQLEIAEGLLVGLRAALAVELGLADGPRLPPSVSQEIQLIPPTFGQIQSWRPRC